MNRYAIIPPGTKVLSTTLDKSYMLQLLFHSPEHDRYFILEISDKGIFADYSPFGDQSGVRLGPACALQLWLIARKQGVLQHHGYLNETQHQ